MNNTVILILIIGAVLALAIGTAVYFRRRRTKNLQSQFGPEYKTVLDRYGDQSKAEGRIGSARETRSQVGNP